MRVEMELGKGWNERKVKWDGGGEDSKVGRWDVM